MELYQEFLETQTHLKTLYSTLAEMSQSIDNTNQETAVLEKALDSAQIKLSEQNKRFFLVLTLFYTLDRMVAF